MKYPLMFLFILLGAALGCNLSTVPPTPIQPPSPTPGPIQQQQPTNLPGFEPALERDTDVGVDTEDIFCSATPADWVGYIIEPGDSLGLLAEQTGSTVDQLVTANCLDNPDAITIGTVIFLPRIPTIVSD
jgi:hypothetical protein